jgi:hypothetical protein
MDAGGGSVGALIATPTALCMERRKASGTTIRGLLAETAVVHLAR